MAAMPSIKLKKPTVSNMIPAKKTMPTPRSSAWPALLAPLTVADVIFSSISPAACRSLDSDLV
jgi:hypothetical protein